MPQIDTIQVKTDSSATQHVFGLDLAFLPDFLGDHTLLGVDPDARIIEHLRRWSQFVGGLWSDDSAGYLLRYSLDPSAGEASAIVRVRLLGRAGSQVDAQMRARHLGTGLRSLGFRPAGVSSAAVAKELTSTSGHAFEVRQSDRRVRTRVADPSGHQDHYLVSPWWGPAGSFLAPFFALVQQVRPVEVSILLRPTKVSPVESELLAANAAFGTTAAASTQKGDSQGFAAHYQADPQAEWFGRLSAAQLRRLDRAFLTSIVVRSDDKETARAVAVAFASTISAGAPHDPPYGEDRPLASQASVQELVAEDRVALSRALSTCSFLVPAAGDSTLRESERRLRYLVDCHGAATAFRFPVSIRGGVPGFTVRQQPPDFHPGPLAAARPALMLGALHGGGVAEIPLADLTKHCLVTGFTGSGKTQTVLHILHELWRRQECRVPFLVLETAKSEYRGLMGCQAFHGRSDAALPDLRIYTPGNDSCAPFRLNPFELIEGVRLESHIARLHTCFEATLPPVGPLPSLLQEAIERVYLARGWSMADVGRAANQPQPDFPTMTDLYACVRDVVARRAYSGEVERDLKAAIEGRIKPLTRELRGSKGRMFDTQRCRPSPADLFGPDARPTILEMNDLGLSDKALVSMFVLTLLREYRERNPSIRKDAPAHVTVVEEAHNVLENVASAIGEDSADPRGKAVQSICLMLSEVRSLGEAILIADQSPKKLARDALRNTNLQIAHALRDSEDREAVATAMLMTDEQRDFLGKLRPGHAAVFFTGLEQATFVKVPNLMTMSEDEPFSGAGSGFLTRVDDEQVARHMAPLTAGVSEWERPFGAECADCPRVCTYRYPILAVDRKQLVEAAGIVDEVWRGFRDLKDRDRLHAELRAVARRVAHAAGHGSDIHASWCAYMHIRASCGGAAHFPGGLRRAFLES